uniref:Early nodulin-like protein 1 n=1 Tax=Noccaea caerulescens TaxID=107243 RepID=A0A1J3HK79_NOCCA
MVWSQKHLSSMLFFFSFCFLSLFSRPSLSSTFTVDGVSVWKTPIVHVGDSVIFRHKYGYDLYIFRSKDAFSVCNFTQATLLTKPNSTSFTWYPSRTGSYYFSFTNNTSLPKTCQLNQKLTVQVILAAAATPPSQPPTPAISPAPVSEGGVISSSPSYPWPLGPREGSAFSPGPSPSEITSVTVPGKDGVPFINSNPAVPLPTGEVDSTSINPLPTSTNSAHQVMMTVTVNLGLSCVAMFFHL